MGEDYRNVPGKGQGWFRVYAKTQGQFIFLTMPRHKTNSYSYLFNYFVPDKMTEVEEKSWELSLYESLRTPQEAITDNTGLNRVHVLFKNSHQLLTYC